LIGLDWSVLQIKTKIVSCHTADSKPGKQEVNGDVIPPDETELMDLRRKVKNRVNVTFLRGTRTEGEG